MVWVCVKTTLLTAQASRIIFLLDVILRFKTVQYFGVFSVQICVFIRILLISSKMTNVQSSFEMKIVLLFKCLNCYWINKSFSSKPKQKRIEILNSVHYDDTAIFSSHTLCVCCKHSKKQKKVFSLTSQSLCGAFVRLTVFVAQIWRTNVYA